MGLVCSLRARLRSSIIQEALRLKLPLHHTEKKSVQVVCDQDASRAPPKGPCMLNILGLVNDKSGVVSHASSCAWLLFVAIASVFTTILLTQIYRLNRGRCCNSIEKMRPSGINKHSVISLFTILTEPALMWRFCLNCNAYHLGKYCGEYRVVAKPLFADTMTNTSRIN